MNQLKPNSTLPVLLVAIAVTLTSGFIHGRVSGRWGPSSPLARASERLSELPDTIGNWQLQANRELSRDAIEMLRCAGYLNQSYVNRNTGETIGVTVMLGPSGPMAVHAPEVCYSASNYELIATRTRIEATTQEGVHHALWNVLFETKDASRSHLRVFYGWSTGTKWVAPEHPRFEFAGQPILYKIQISHPLPPGESSTKSSVCLEFFQALLPHLQSRLGESNDG